MKKQRNSFFHWRNSIEWDHRGRIRDNNTTINCMDYNRGNGNCLSTMVV
jgi:hypothetical protein